MSRLLPLIVGTLVLAGCSTIRVYDSVDLSNKSITVPPGGGLTGAIKDRLHKDGWKVVVYRGPAVTEGALGESTRLETSRKFSTRYTLFLKWNQFDVCIPRFDPAYNFDISLVDNSTGSEVLTLSGRGCEHGIADKFQEALHTPQN